MAFDTPTPTNMLKLCLCFCVLAASGGGGVMVQAKMRARHASNAMSNALYDEHDSHATTTTTKDNHQHATHTVASGNSAQGAAGGSNGASEGGSSGEGGNSGGSGGGAIVSFMDQMSWQCANNASCIYALANRVMQSYQRGDTIKLGPIELIKLPPPPSTTTTKSSSTSKSNNGSGRGLSSFVDFLHGNAIRIPIGPMVFSVQRAEHDENYIEIALLKKAVQQGRRGGEGLLGGGGGGGGDSSGIGGGLLGGGGSGSGSGGGILGHGGGGGGGGGGGPLRHRKEKKEDKKQFEMYIPMYLAATTFGWTMVAAKAVGLLTLKALVVSKLAFVVAAMVIIKKLMDNASSEKMMYQYPEHAPYMMPYSMDYPMHAAMGGGSGGGGGMEMGGDMYPAALHLAAAAAAPAMGQHSAHSGMESLGAESSLHHSFADMQNNNTQVLAALNAVGLGQKVKREDSWIAKSAAVAAAAAGAGRRPLVYNYMQPHHHHHPHHTYYRTQRK